MAAKKRIIASRKKSSDQNLETTFPKKFFNKIWYKFAEHEYIDIFEIKFEKIILFKNGGQNKVF